MEDRAYVIDEEAERPGFFTKVSTFFSRDRDIEGDEETEFPTSPKLRVHQAPRYSITVRRQVTSFNDAVAAADGLKNGEQQIMNLSAADAHTREKIKDFMAGVNYAQEGHWEELGDNVYLLAPHFAAVDTVAASPKAQAQRN
ncbi:MAG: cell division protein SepF [Armatimonadetes bacterium]|nr:cell division protein SepF [Armatimonadota bacterium]